MSRKKGEQLTSEGIIIDGMFNNMPYEGRPLNLKKDDPPHMQLRLVASVSVDTFMMNNQEHVERYTKYMEDVSRGWAEISREEVEFIPARETWKIFLRLMHKKYIEPEDTTRVTEI